MRGLATLPATASGGHELAERTDFASAIAVYRDGEGRWRGRVDPDWVGTTRPHGGVMAAHALAALRAELADPALALRSATISFPAAIETDAIVVDTRIVRAGRSVVQTGADVRDSDAGEICLDVSAAFGRTRTSNPRFTDPEFPEVAEPDACVAERSPFGDVAMSPLPPIFEQLERRFAIGALPWDADWVPGGPARVCRWVRFRRPTTADAGLDPLALVVVADLPGPAVWTKLGPDDFYVMSSVQLTVHLLDTPEAAANPWLLADYRATWAGDGYTTTETLIWDEHGSLLATCKQLMALHRMPPP